MMNNMPKWEQQLRVYHSLVEELANEREKSEGKLRFDRLFIIASDIAQQYFCEKKVEMQYLYGDVETAEKTIGTEAHEKLLEDSVKIKERDLWRKIYGKKPFSVLEMPLLAKHNDVILAGRPDSVLFCNGYPIIVFEYKFSKNPTVYKAHLVQARTYGMLLNNMGFDTSQLFYAIVIADPEARYDKELKRKVFDAVDKNGLKEAVLNIEKGAVYFHKFTQADAEKDLDWAIEFWKKTREPIMTSNPNKCRSCVYWEECQKT
jgi:CRISPR/Cas system-associated exonuclease Cas4 (RecB family)